jgi:hypothetical protein
VPGQERVFLLADNLPAVRMLTRFCCRRAFPMTLPKYLGSASSDDAVTTELAASMCILMRDQAASLANEAAKARGLVELAIAGAVAIKGVR